MNQVQGNGSISTIREQLDQPAPLPATKSWPAERVTCALCADAHSRRLPAVIPSALRKAPRSCRIRGAVTGALSRACAPLCHTRGCFGSNESTPAVTTVIRGQALQELSAGLPRADLRTQRWTSALPYATSRCLESCPRCSPAPCVSSADASS